MTDRSWVIAHRGASRDRPENTLAAFEEALRQGCDGIELDVQLSRDEVPVVYHDRTLARAGGGRKRVAQLSLAELRALDSSQRGRHIPTLEETLERFGRRTRLLIEIKTREGAAGGQRHALLARSVAAQVTRMKLTRNVLVLAFDPEMLEHVAARAPRIGRVLNLRPPQRLPRKVAELLPSLFALSVDVRSLRPSFASAVRRAGCRLLTYTCNTKGTVRRSVEAGAVGVMSDRPAWLGETLRSLRGDAA